MTRRSPVRIADSWARKSPIARDGTRTLALMMSVISVFSTPARKCLTNGSCSPSEKISRVMPPNCPPISCQCAIDEENATSSPSLKIGSV